MLAKRLRSVGYAITGIKLAWREEANFRTELVLGACAIGAGALFQITYVEWLVLLGWCAVVLMAEAFNTALEELCDMLRTTHDPHVAKIKDLAAAAVLIASCGAFVTGCLIFVPRVLALI